MCDSKQLERDEFCQVMHLRKSSGLPGAAFELKLN